MEDNNKKHTDFSGYFDRAYEKAGKSAHVKGYSGENYKADNAYRDGYIEGYLKAREDIAKHLGDITVSELLKRIFEDARKNASAKKYDQDYKDDYTDGYMEGYLEALKDYCKESWAEIIEQKER